MTNHGVAKDTERNCAASPRARTGHLSQRLQHNGKLFAGQGQMIRDERVGQLLEKLLVRSAREELRQHAHGLLSLFRPLLRYGSRAPFAKRALRASAAEQRVQNVGGFVW